jgi:hypothetical protein
MQQICWPLATTSYSHQTLLLKLSENSLWCVKLTLHAETTHMIVLHWATKEFCQYKEWHNHHNQYFPQEASNMFSIQCALHANCMWINRTSTLTASGLTNLCKWNDASLNKNQVRVNSVKDCKNRVQKLILTAGSQQLQNMNHSQPVWTKLQHLCGFGWQKFCARDLSDFSDVCLNTAPVFSGFLQQLHSPVSRFHIWKWSGRPK